MLPLRPAALFRSRWAALLYAGGILWFAMNVADTERDEAGGTNVAIAATDPVVNDATISALEAQVHLLEASSPPR